MVLGVALRCYRGYSQSELSCKYGSYGICYHYSYWFMVKSLLYCKLAVCYICEVNSSPIHPFLAK